MKSKKQPVAIFGTLPPDPHPKVGIRDIVAMLQTVPKKSRIQQWTLDYILKIEPVKKTLREIITAVLLMKGGETDPANFPASVREHKAFKGYGEDYEFLKERLEYLGVTLLVGRGFIAQEMGNAKDVIHRHLDKSESFHIGFSTARNVRKMNTEDGFEFIILRSGELHKCFRSYLHAVTLPFFG